MITCPRSQSFQYRVSLRQHTSDSCVFKIRRIFISPQDSFHQNAKPRASAVAVCPVDADIGPKSIQQFMRYHFELVVAQHIESTLIVGQGVIKGDLFVGEAGFFTALPRLSNFFCQRNQFLQHFDSADGVGMIARNGLIQPFRELTRLNHVGSAAGADLVGKKLLEGFQRQILFLHLINLRQAGDLLQTGSAEITPGEGALRVSVGGDMQLARIATTNATRDALTLEVVGALDVAAGQGPLQIVANSIGALSELRIGQMLPEGPTGLQVALAALDLEAGLGDIYLNEADGIILQSVVARNGLIDIFSAGRTEIHAIRSVSAAPIVLTTSTGDMLADNAVISGGDTRIIALEGALGGVTFRADTLDGRTLHLFAGTDLRYAETAGDLRVGFALADQGDLTIEAQDGSQSIGVLGANGALTLRARDSLRVTMIGETTVDLADEVALSLVNPGAADDHGSIRYGDNAVVERVCHARRLRGKATLPRCLCDKVRAVRWRHTIHASGRCDRRDWR